MLSDISTIINMSKALKLLGLMETALTVGIIAFTVFRIISGIRKIKE